MIECDFLAPIFSFWIILSRHGKRHFKTAKRKYTKIAIRVLDGYCILSRFRNRLDLESISHIRHWKEPLLILTDNGVGAWVIGLRKNVLVT